MFRLAIIRASLSSAPIKQQIFRSTLATSTTATTTTTTNEIIDHFPSSSPPPPYTLATLRSFPSLEPHSIIPVHSKFINAPLRRDILWQAVVMELDNRRVGSSNPPGRSDHKFSRHKLHAQKGTGQARVGDANSPIRFRGAYALARTAPNDHTSELPTKVYDLAYRIALSSYYKSGKLFIIGEDSNFSELSKTELNREIKLKEGDSFNLNICTNDSHAIGKFLNHHEFNDLNVLFITDDLSRAENLKTAIKYYPSKRISIMNKDDVEVRDLLKANRIIMEKDALLYFGTKYTKSVTF